MPRPIIRALPQGIRPVLTLLASSLALALSGAALATSAQAAPQTVTVTTLAVPMRSPGGIATGLVVAPGGALTVAIGPVPDACVALGPGNFDESLLVNVGTTGLAGSPGFGTTTTLPVTAGGQLRIAFTGIIEVNVPGRDACTAATTPVTFTYTSPVDTTAPATTIDTHPANPTNASAASFAFHATDPDDTSGFVFVCSLDGAAFAACSSPANYTSLADGSHTFKVHATDAVGNTGTDASFTWRVDTTTPTLQLPAPITANATSPAGAVVSYAATATDPDDDAAGLTVSCMPASGSTFPKRATTVSCTATDRAGNSSSTGSFTVTVTDVTAPTLQLPGNQTVSATSPTGAPVTYSSPVSATDATDAAATLTVSCAPGTLTGGSFPIGTTPVSCTATDPAGNRGSGSFTVTVKGAPEQLIDLRTAVRGVGPGTSLADAVAEAQASLAAGDRAGACGTLRDFLALVQAQSGKSIPTAQAQPLVTTATRIRTVLGCS